MKSIGVLGGGLSGLAIANFYEGDSQITILEKNDSFGGLARSYRSSTGVCYDVGPHIIFSKDKEILDYMTSLSPMNKIRRSNKIVHKNKLVTYPFENFLAQMEDEEDIEYCLSTFIRNPYRNLPAQNMHAFFLKTFGEGITETYLRPYNDKIWKFAPAMMNTKMVNRIPTPPQEDIIKSAKGEFSDGYLHQLYFYYPVTGGTQAMIDSLEHRAREKNCHLSCDSEVIHVEKNENSWIVKTSKETLTFDHLVSCMPIHELVAVTPQLSSLSQTMEKLLYNSLYVVILTVKDDTAGDNYTFTLADMDVIFHRINKIDFLGENYSKAGHSTFMAEVTFREKDRYDLLGEDEVVNRCIGGLEKIGFIADREQVVSSEVLTEKYAYVIYDLDHEDNITHARSVIDSFGIDLCGRFSEFEYLNMDKILEHAKQVAAELE